MFASPVVTSLKDALYVYIVPVVVSEIVITKAGAMHPGEHLLRHNCDRKNIAKVKLQQRSNLLLTPSNFVQHYVPTLVIGLFLCLHFIPFLLYILTVKRNTQ